MPSPLLPHEGGCPMAKLIEVRWSRTENCSYYVDKDKFSKAHDHRDHISLNSFEGTYRFCKIDRSVTLDDGVRTRPVNVLSWTTTYDDMN